MGWYMNQESTLGGLKDITNANMDPETHPES